MLDEPWIFLHGWGMSPRVFDRLAPVVGPRLLTPALPGYAGSRWAFAADFDRQVEAVAADLPAGRLFGWSLGGLYAIELARRFPAKFSALTLIASNPCFHIRADWPAAIDAGLLRNFHRELRIDWRRTRRRFLALQAQGDEDARRVARELARMLAADGAPEMAALEFGLDLLAEADLRNALAGLGQPVALILGDRDRLVPLALGAQIAEVLPRIRVECVAGAAHAPFLSHPAQFAALLPLP